jgi:hypothetical protein
MPPFLCVLWRNDEFCPRRFEKKSLVRDARRSPWRLPYFPGTHFPATPRREKVDSHRNEPMLGYSERECRLKKERCQEVFGEVLPVAGECLLNGRESITGGPSPKEK